jgi:hypothetical protein
MNKKLLAISVLLVLSQPALAVSVIPNLSITSLGGSPNAYLDIIAEQSGLTGTFSRIGKTTDWTLNISGYGTGNILTPSSGNYTVINNSYFLNAEFTSAGKLVSGSLSIFGDVLGVPGANGLLLSEQLTKFGYNASQTAIGFDTIFTGGYADQPRFTGGSGGDVSYLFGQPGSGSLGGLISEFADLSKHPFSNISFSNVTALTAVPLPLPAVLFVSGLTALLGMGRKRNI